MSVTPPPMASGPADGTVPSRMAYGGHPSNHRGQRSAGQGIRTPAGEAHDAEPLGVERVGHLRDVGDPVGHRAVAVSIGQPGPRPLNEDDPQAEPLGGTPPKHRELPPGSQCAVEPQHHRAGGVTELGVAKPATVGKVELAFGARLFDARYPGGMPQRVAQFHRFSKCRRPGEQPMTSLAAATRRFPRVGQTFRV